MAPAYSHIVSREPGPQTASGPGDIIIDSHGRRYREIDSADAARLRNTTNGQVYTLHSDGTIR